MTSALTRKTPLKRSRTLGAHTPRPKAQVKAGKRVRRPSAKAETRRKDREFSLSVRARGSCEIRLAKRCRGTPDNCCHLISRRYRNVRYAQDNAVAGCYPCHLYGTVNPAAWQLFCIARLGLEGYRALLQRAYGGEK